MGRLFQLGVALAFAGVIGAAVWGLGSTTTAMPPSVFRITITNMTDPPATLSAGALVAHCADGDFWSEGGHASAEVKAIAEGGNPGAAVSLEQEETAMGMTFLQERYNIGEVGPGASVSVEEVFEFGCKLSSAQQLVGSEDSFVGANSVGMWDPDTHLPLELVTVDLMAYDAGTMDEGAESSDAISASSEWSGVQARLTIEFLDPFEDDSMEEDSMEEDSMEDDSMEEDSMEEDSMEDESMEADSMEDDKMEDDRAGLPNAGSGGIADQSNSRTSALTYVLGLLAVVGIGAGAVGVRRLVRQRR